MQSSRGVFLAFLSADISGVGAESSAPGQKVKAGPPLPPNESPNGTPTRNSKYRIYESKSH